MAEYDDEFVDAGSQGPPIPAFLTDPLGILKRRWLWMLLAGAVSTLPAVALVLSQRMEYKASAKVMLAGQTIPTDLVRSTIAEGVDEQVNAMAVEVLSRPSLGALVDEHDLVLETDTTQEEIIQRLREAITIKAEQAVNTGGGRRASLIYVIGVSWHDPLRAALVANDVAARLMEVNIRRRTVQTTRTTEFLRREMERVGTAQREQTRLIASFNAKHRGELPSELSMNLARLERLQQQRELLSMQISQAEGRLLVRRAARPNDDPEALHLAELRQSLAEQRAAHTDEHPNVRALMRQLEETEARLAARDPSEREAHGGMAAAALVAAERDVAQMRAQLQAIGPQMTELEGRVGRTPQVGEELAALEQRELGLRENYSEALHKVNDAELAENLERAQHGAQISHVEAARPPTRPTRPRSQLIVVAIVAVISAMGLAGVGLELIDPVIVSRAQTEQMTAMPLLGSIPRIS